MNREWLVDNLSYCPESGQFRWRKPGKKRVVGALAGTLGSHGYVQLHLQHRIYKAAHLAWLYMVGEFPPPGMVIDHIDGDRANDRWCNLRLATHSENSQNSARRANRSGKRGVSWGKSNNKWQAQIKCNGTSYHLGYFDTVEEASKAYEAAKSQLHGEFSCQRTTS